MSYDEQERSNFDALPIALYEFSTGTKSWLYSSDVEDTTSGGRVFKGIAASDSGTTQSGDAQNDEAVITLPRNAEFAQLFFGTPPAGEIWVSIRRGQHGDDVAPIYWMGTLTSAKQAGSTTIELTCHTLIASFDRTGARLSWGRQCPHALYDRNCRVNKQLYATNLQVRSLTGNSITSPALATLPDGYLSNGFFEFEISDGVLDRRPIETHSGNSFSILGTSDGIKVDDWMTVYPGCNRTTSNCVSKFNNLSNYGGIPALPGKSPFDGDPVF